MTLLYEPRRILLVRNDRLGDLVLTMPAIEAVRRHWPEAHLAALVSAYAGPLLARSDMLDELIVDDPAESAWHLGRRLRAGAFDVAVVFNTNTRNVLAVWWARIRTRVCWAYKPLGMLLGTRRVAIERSHPPIHEAEFALEFVRKLGVRAELAHLTPHLPVDLLVRERIAARIYRELGSFGPLFGVHPCNKKSAYNWPLSRYAELITPLAYTGRVMVTGSPDERPYLEALHLPLAAIERRRVGLFTDFQLSELIAALSLPAALTVSSTGPMHIAGVLGTPLVALFSPHPSHVPAKWAPLGTNHTLLVAPLRSGESAEIGPEQGDELMSRITLDEVLNANLDYARKSPELYGKSKAA